MTLTTYWRIFGPTAKGQTACEDTSALQTDVCAVQNELLGSFKAMALRKNRNPMSQKHHTTPKSPFCFLSTGKNEYPQMNTLTKP